MRKVCKASVRSISISFLNLNFFKMQNNSVDLYPPPPPPNCKTNPLTSTPPQHLPLCHLATSPDHLNHSPLNHTRTFTIPPPEVATPTLTNSLLLESTSCPAPEPTRVGEGFGSGGGGGLVQVGKWNKSENLRNHHLIHLNYPPHRYRQPIPSPTRDWSGFWPQGEGVGSGRGAGSGVGLVHLGGGWII